MKERKLHLYQDRPEFSEIKFAHLVIADWLKGILKNVPRPFRFAITGDLGVGKSTIIKKALDSLEEKYNNKYRTAYVDVWKLDKDSARRSAILRIAREFNINLKKTKVLEEKIYGITSDISIVKPSRLRFNGISFTLLLFSLLFGWVVYHLSGNIEKLDSSERIIAGIAVAIFTTFIRLFEKTFTRVQRTVSRSPIVGSEEFEESLIKINFE